jgi:hypothetical protein
MGSKLKKKTRYEPKGYDKKSIAKMADSMTRRRNTDALIEEAYVNVRLIAYQILHDKFGFGKKRIARVDETIDKYLIKAAKDEVTESEMIFLLKQKYDIDVKAEANKVPFLERFALTKSYILPESRQSAGMYLLASICNYFALLGCCLKTQFKFSKNSIEKAFWHIRGYINTLHRFKQFGLTIPMIAESVKDECGYIDNRFYKGV